MKHELDDEDNFSGNDSTTNEEWEPGSKMSRMADYKVTSPSYSSTDSNGPIIKTTGKTSNRPTGPRKPRHGQEVILSVYSIIVGFIIGLYSTMIILKSWIS